MNKIILEKSEKPDKRFKVIVDGKTIHFGSGRPTGLGAFIDHKNENIKRAWEARHRVREDWTKSGIKTAGFYAKNILWNKKTLDESIKDTEKKFDLKIIKKI